MRLTGDRRREAMIAKFVAEHERAGAAVTRLSRTEVLVEYLLPDGSWEADLFEIKQWFEPSGQYAAPSNRTVKSVDDEGRVS